MMLASQVLFIRSKATYELILLTEYAMLIDNMTVE